MDWVSWIGVGFICVQLCLLTYAVFHCNEPFWHGFLDPFGLRPELPQDDDDPA